LTSIEVKDGCVILSVDAEDERRLAIKWTPYQGVRITTIDCVAGDEFSVWPGGGLFEVEDSPWIEELIGTLARVDETATFLRDARHYVMALQDEVVEVVATHVEWSR